MTSYKMDQHEVIANHSTRMFSFAPNGNKQFVDLSGDFAWSQGWKIALKEPRFEKKLKKFKPQTLRFLFLSNFFTRIIFNFTF